MVYTRYESQIASSPRHEMEVHVRLGADENGIFQAIDLYTLSNTGAFGEHGPTTVGLSGHKSIPIYSARRRHYRFCYDVVYTNTHVSRRVPRLRRDPGCVCCWSPLVNELAAGNFRWIRP